MYVGVKNKNYNDKLEKLHNIEEKILDHYGIVPTSSGMNCFKCGVEKLGFFIAKNKTENDIESKRNYLKCKCWSCNFVGDILDIVKLIDIRFKNKKNTEIVDLLLTDRFFKVKPPYFYNQETNLKKSKMVKVIETEDKKKDYIKFLNAAEGNFIKIINRDIDVPRVFNYIKNRGFKKEDFKYLRGYLGVEIQEREEHNPNLIFKCTDYTFTRRFLTERMDVKTRKLQRYQNSKSLLDSAHYCYLLEMVTLDRIIRNNYRNIYICEGIFDALTVRVLCKNSCLAFATGGAVSNHNLIAERLKKVAKEVYFKTGKRLNLIPLFDTDTAGEKGQNNLAEVLKNDYVRVFNSISKMILKSGKDVNEELQKNRENLEYVLNYVDSKLKEL
jgi:hypothetical protein